MHSHLQLLTVCDNGPVKSEVYMFQHSQDFHNTLNK